jgi:ABC-type lipoprotein release transport system permease subunit
MASIPILVLGFEIMQIPGIIPGTFCIQDIALGLLGLLLGIYIGTMKTKNNNYHEKAFE